MSNMNLGDEWDDVIKDEPRLTPEEQTQRINMYEEGAEHIGRRLSPDEQQKRLEMYESGTLDHDPTNIQPTNIEMERNSSLQKAFINKFIQESVPLNLRADSYITSEWGSADTNRQNKYNEMAYSYFQKAFEKARMSSPIIAAMDFPNFVKIHNDSETFNNNLRVGTFRPGDPEHMYNYIYSQDWGLFRKSALEGFKLYLEDNMMPMGVDNTDVRNY